MGHPREGAPTIKAQQWPPLWSPRKLRSVSCMPGKSALLQREEQGTTARMHRLVVQQVIAGSERPAKLFQTGDLATRERARFFAESCLMSVAMWRRFGTAEFAEALGWLERTDYAAMMQLVTIRAVEAAVQVWKQGQHAAAGHCEAQRSVCIAEMRAWELGNGAAGSTAYNELREAEHRFSLMMDPMAKKVAKEDIMRLRAACVTAAGEVAVRQAYERLLHARHHPFWDLWRKRDHVIKAALGNGGFEAVREALLQVTGFCGPNPDGERAGWELAFDLKTITPLSDDPGPVDWSGSYVAWLRRRTAERCPIKAAPCTARRRPLAAAALDLTGL